MWDYWIPRESFLTTNRLKILKQGSRYDIKPHLYNGIKAHLCSTILDLVQPINEWPRSDLHQGWTHQCQKWFTLFGGSFHFSVQMCPLLMQGGHWSSIRGCTKSWAVFNKLYELQTRLKLGSFKQAKERTWRLEKLWSIVKVASRIFRRMWGCQEVY